MGSIQELGEVGRKGARSQFLQYLYKKGIFATKCSQRGKKHPCNTLWCTKMGVLATPPPPLVTNP